MQPKEQSDAKTMSLFGQPKLIDSHDKTQVSDKGTNLTNNDVRLANKRLKDAIQQNPEMTEKAKTLALADLNKFEQIRGKELEDQFKNTSREELETRFGKGCDTNPQKLASQEITKTLNYIDDLLKQKDNPNIPLTAKDRANIAWEVLHQSASRPILARVCITLAIQPSWKYKCIRSIPPMLLAWFTTLLAREFMKPTANQRKSYVRQDISDTTYCLRH